MRVKDTKIGTQLKIGLGATLLLVILLGALAWIQTGVLLQNTQWLYDHPLKVRRAIGVLETDIMGMRVEIRNAVLTGHGQEVETAQLKSAVYQANAEQQFDILFQQYLGPPADIETAHNLFVGWLSSRENNWALARDGKRPTVISRIADTGDLGIQRTLLLEQIRKIDNFAATKSDRLYRDARLLNDSLKIQLLLMVGCIILITSGIGYFMFKGIKAPLKELTTVAEGFRKGNFEARCQYVSANELGLLSASFNEMADAISLRIETQKKSSALAETLTVETGLKEFAGTVLEKFMDITQSTMGAFYSCNEDDSRFLPLAVIGVNPELAEPFDALIFEGEFGKALKTGKASHIQNIPKETIFKFKTFAGTAIPREMITLPVVVKGRIRGMLSLACLSPYSKAALGVLTQSSVIALNTAFANLLANDRTRRLSETLRARNQELQAQQEELQAQTEELRKQSEEMQAQNVELQQQRLAVEAASRLKSQFLSNMSHELRTPLNSVMALSRVLMLQAKTKLSDEEVDYLAIIQRNGKNLLTLINDILDLSKIEAGRMDIKPRFFSPGQTLENILESIEPLAAEKQIKIRQDISATLMPLESDEIRVTQILQNLIANAVKFTLAGNVTITAKSDQKKIFIQVADTGIGIAETDLPHVFDEFRQVDGSSSRRHEGTGLGLAIAHKAAWMLGGELSLKSKLGVGSTFTLTLPLAWQGQVRSLERITAAQPVGGKPVLKTILVVDDDPRVAEMIAGYLIQEGYHTLIAASGEEALKLAASERPFAVTLDIIMPDMDGWEILQGLKNNPETRDIPVIIVSVSEEKETGIALGAVGYVPKPVSKKMLITEIRKIKRILKALDPGSKHPKRSATLPRILMVEDNEAAIIQIKSVLAGAGYAVDVTRSGQDVFDYISHTIPDGIVMDLMMPEIDGFDVLEKIRSRPVTAKIPVLILTAKDLTPEDFKRLSANHVQQFVQKGDVDQASLLFKIKSMLKGDDKGMAGILTPKTGGMPPRHHVSRPATILIVEDNPDNMTTIRAVLQNRYPILEAWDGEQGLEMAAQTIPDLILLDMALPKMDGMAVVQQLKSNQQLCHIPVIALTAKVMKGDREKILTAGCNDYISKPIDPVGFLEKITQWLKG